LDEEIAKLWKKLENFARDKTKATTVVALIDIQRVYQRISMGLTVFRETPKKLAVSRENEKKITVSCEYFL